MAEINLSKYGITGTTEIVHNPSYEELFKEEMKPELKGYEKGQETELGAVNVMTGIYTGRSPKDKFIVEDENSKNTVWWTSDEYKNDNHRTILSCFFFPVFLKNLIIGLVKFSCRIIRNIDDMYV